MDCKLISNTKNTEYIYIDCVFSNTNPVLATPVIFDQRRSVPIVDNMQNYKLAVLSVNGKFYNPYFVLGDEIQRVMIRYNPDNLEAIEYIPSNGVLIYTAEQYLEYVNAAYLSAFNSIVAQYDGIYGPGAWTGNVLLPQYPPGLIYDSATQLFTIYADARCVDTNVNRISIYMDLNVYAKFVGLAFTENVPTNEWNLLNFYTGFADSNLVTLGTGPQMVKSAQDSPSIATWSDIASLIVTSNALSCRKEEVAITTEKGVNTSADIYNIVTSFPMAKKYVLDRDIFFQNPELNWIDLQQPLPLQRLSFELQYLLFDGGLRPVYIGNNDSIIVKFVLAKTTFVS